MLIKYIFGPRAGETEHVDRVSAKPLILAHIAEAVNPDDLKDPSDGVVHAGNETYQLPRPGDWKGFPTTWSVEVFTHEGTGPQDAGRQHLIIKRVVTRGRFADSVWCAAHPDCVHDRRYNNGGLFCSAFGCPVPPEILKEYKQKWNANKALRATEEKRPVPDALDAKADKATIERVMEGSAAYGVSEGQRLIQRPGPRH